MSRVNTDLNQFQNVVTMVPITTGNALIVIASIAIMFILQPSLALLAVIFTAETLWNSLVARLFALERSRARYISLKTVIDRAFGGLLAALGVKIAAT